MKDSKPTRRTRRPPQNSGLSEGHGRKSEAVREAAVLALLSERTLTEAAARAGINEKTLRDWLADDPDFRARYEQARRAVFEQGIGRVQALVGKAVDKLEALLGSEVPSVQLGAARSLVELGVHQQDAEVILRKLDEIEARQQQGRGR